MDNTDCDDADAGENPNVMWYADSDGDGDVSSSVVCERSASTDVMDNMDCDDTDAGENPNVTWYADSDGDLYGDPNGMTACVVMLQLMLKIIRP